ncbi:MAG: GTPase domain-containing protein, partial [Psychromonas sp.]
MSHKGLSIAVVGHANAGKTSLMRTLLRDAEFGQVADQAGTTRHVEGGSIRIEGADDFSLFDTPGLEDSIRLFAILKGFFKNQTVDGIERLQFFLENLADYPELEQEAKVLRALLKNDIIFYVIDLREPILGKYRDELKILSFAAKPIIPV